MMGTSAWVLSVFDKRAFGSSESLPVAGSLARMDVNMDISLGVVVAWGTVLLLVCLGLAPRLELQKGEDVVNGER